MRKRIAGIFLAALLLVSVTARAQGTRETEAMLRAFERLGLYAQGFEVRYAVTRTPAQAVPLLQKAQTLAGSLPQGAFTTEEKKEQTQLLVACRVAPTRGTVQDACSRMRRVLGMDGETTLTLYGLVPDTAEAQEETLRALLENLGDGVHSTRRSAQGVVLLGAAYQVGATQDSGRVRIAIARPRFYEKQE